MRYLRFGAFCVDLDQRRLLRDGQPIELPARAFDVLYVLVHAPHQLLTRERLFELVWKDSIVEDSNLTQAVWVLRRALGDDAKSYIRTVAKHGYVFEPHEAIIFDLAVPSDRLVPEAPAVEELPVAAPVPVDPVRTARLPRHAAVAIAAGLLLLAAAAWHWLAPATAISSVIIVETRGDDTNDRANAMNGLLHDWLQWKFGTLHQIDSVGDSVAPEPNDGTQHVILLSTHRQANPLEQQIQAHVFGAGNTAHFALPAVDFSQIDALDAFSRRLVAAIVPGAEHDIALRLTPEAAEHYVAAKQALARGDRAAQVEQLRQAQAAAPQSGWLRAQLIEVLADLGQTHAARSELERNVPWTLTLPATAQQLMRARRLEIAQQSREAAQVYADLAREFPSMTELRLAQARVLNDDQRLREAAAVLDTLDGASLPVDQRIEWLKLRVPYEYYQQSPRVAQATLRKIVDLAGDSPRLGLSKAIAEGQALGMEAMDATNPQAGANQIAALDAAADRAAAAGSPIEAAKLRLQAALAVPAQAPELLPQRLAALLALAHANGDIHNEMWGLYVGAMGQGRLGNIPAQRALLLQGEAVAQANDFIPGLRDAAKFLGQDALRSGRYEEAERRFDSTRGDSISRQIGQGLAALYTAQGRYDEAEQAIDLADAVQPDAQIRSTTPLGAGCWLGTIQLARANLAPAQALYTDCAAQANPQVALEGKLGLAQVAQISGNREQARTQALVLADSVSGIGHRVQRMGLSAGVAQLLADVGEYAKARAMLGEIVTFAQKNGLAPLEARAHAVAMQIALADGNGDEALRDYAAAGKVLPASDWRTRARLDTLRAIAYRNSGDIAAMRQQIEAVVADARKRDDAVAELTALSIDDRDDTQAQRIVQTGARGATLRELVRADAPK